ncbi:aconitate hydratase AcnA [Verrucomicrobiota bacterium sgz303538]
MSARETQNVLRLGERRFEYFSLRALDPDGRGLTRLPYSLRILLENLLRHEDDVTVTRDQIDALLAWDPARTPSQEIAFSPARVLLQDFTGVPAVVDLAAMREAMKDLGGDPRRINPLLPAELVIDHSMQVDAFASPDAERINADLEFQRNRERYAFLRWGQRAFDNFQVVPPDTGIVHQVNLEFLARVVFASHENGHEFPQAFPDTVVGTDSHTTMINGLGVLGWGVGGIEAEAAMLGQPVSMLIPQVVGFRLEGALREGVTSTDLVLTVTQMLRAKGVVGKFVEFFGPGVAALPLADRATIGNMAPEYGATCGFFPVDEETLRYLRFTGRPESHVSFVEAYMREQGLLLTADSPEPEYSDTLALDLSTVEPSVAGPRRPQDRVPLSRAKESFTKALEGLKPSAGPVRSQKGSAAGGDAAVWGEGTGGPPPTGNGHVNGDELKHGAVVIASITSCTNTSNPSVMLAAGLLARKAAERGLKPKPWVKTSLAPGSKVVTQYFEAAGLTRHLEQLGFHLVGYGCATCIGNSGPLPPAVSDAVQEHDLVVCSVLSGNRNFEGRINSQVRANYLMSPPLVIAYALAGRMDIDLENEPLGQGKDGKPVFLRDIWPSREEVRRVMDEAVQSEMFQQTYSEVFKGDERWQGLTVPEGDLFGWDPRSTYVKHPPYFEGMTRLAPERVENIRGARVLALLGDSVTTDHISPAGSIRNDSPAGIYLIEHGVTPEFFNSYGSRRGNHEVMVRGTFANVRLRNQLAPGTEGGFTTYLPSGEVMPIYDASMRYQADRTPLLIIAGKEYGSGSSRDWAAKGPKLLGIQAVLAESFERIHRSNLVGMGILPLQFRPDESAASLGLTGQEVFDIEGLPEKLAGGLVEGREVIVRARKDDGGVIEFPVLIRIDTPQEILYYQHGGILPFVVRQLLLGWEQPQAVSAGVAAAAIEPVPNAKVADGVTDEQSIQSFPASDSPAL